MVLRLYRPTVGFDNKPRKVHDFAFGKGVDPRVTVDVTNRFLTHIYLGCKLLMGEDIDVCSDVVDALRDFDTNIKPNVIATTIKRYCGLYFGYPNHMQRPLYLYWAILDPQKYICRFKDNPSIAEHEFNQFIFNPSTQHILYTNADTGEVLIASTVLLDLTMVSSKIERHVYTKRTNTHTEGEWLVRKFGTVRGEKDILLVEDIVKNKGFADGEE